MYSWRERLMQKLSRNHYRLIVISATEVLIHLVLNVLIDEMNGAIDEHELDPVHMTRFESPGDIVVEHRVPRAGGSLAAPGFVDLADRIIDRNDGRIHLGAVERVPGGEEHVRILTGQSLAKQERIGSAVGNVRDPELGPAAANESAAMPDIVG